MKHKIVKILALTYDNNKDTDKYTHTHTPVYSQI